MSVAFLSKGKRSPKKVNHRSIPVVIQKELGPPAVHYLSAAEGWLELGNVTEAMMELASIPADLQDHYEVLHLRWHVHNRLRDWDSCLVIGQKMLDLNPNRPQSWINHGNALFYLGRFNDAYELLLPALEKFPEDEAIPYNLACYRCQSGDLSEAMRWLQQAMKVGDSDRLKRMAVEDPDLKPLWTQTA